MIRTNEWRRVVAVLVSEVVLLQTPLAAQINTPPTAFVDVGIIPMDTERVLLHQTVVVQGGRITALGPSTTVEVPAGARRVDGRNKFLMPGLADMHTHVSRAGPRAIDRVLFMLVANGVTTIRDVEFAPKSTMPGLRPDRVMVQQVQLDGPTMLRLRREIAKGKRWGPRMYLSGPWGLDSTKSVRENLTTYKAAGYDHVKWYGESSSRNPIWTNEKDPQRRFDSLSVVARELGLPLVAHGIENNFLATLRMGLKSIEHLVPYPTHNSRDSVSLQEAVAATVRDGIWNVPTMARFGTVPGALERKYLLAEMRAMQGVEPDSARVRASLSTWWPESKDLAAYQYKDRVIKALQDAGAGILLGTDLPFVPPGYAIHRSLQAYVRAGLTPYQALATGTRNVAAYFGTLDSTGTVAIGKRADLVLLAGNPLEDIRNTSEIAGVMVHGRWLDRAEIERRLDRLYGALLQPVPAGTNIYQP